MKKEKNTPENQLESHKIQVENDQIKKFIEQLESYINHCGDIIIALPRPVLKKREAYQECIYILKHINGYPPDRTISEIAFFTLINMNKLKKILPHEANKEHKAASDNLNDIIKQAKAYSNRQRVSQL